MGTPSQILLLLVVVLCAWSSGCHSEDSDDASRKGKSPEPQAAFAPATPPANMRMDPLIREAQQNLDRAVRLLDQYRHRTGTAPGEFGPCPPVFSCCKNCPDPHFDDKDLYCDAEAYQENGEEWREIGFTHNEASVFSFFGTFEEDHFRASASADLNCDGEPEFVVERIVPLQDDGSLDLDRASWSYSAIAKWSKDHPGGT